MAHWRHAVFAIDTEGLLNIELLRFRNHEGSIDELASKVENVKWGGYQTSKRYDGEHDSQAILEAIKSMRIHLYNSNQGDKAHLNASFNQEAQGDVRNADVLSQPFCEAIGITIFGYKPQQESENIDYQGGAYYDEKGTKLYNEVARLVACFFEFLAECWGIDLEVEHLLKQILRRNDVQVRQFHDSDQNLIAVQRKIYCEENADHDHLKSVNDSPQPLEHAYHKDRQKEVGAHEYAQEIVRC